MRGNAGREGSPIPAELGFVAVGARDYRALAKNGGDGDSLLHLIRDDAEASLCGIPRSSLAAGGLLVEVVCGDCLEWFERRRAVTGVFKTPKQL